MHAYFVDSRGNMRDLDADKPTPTPEALQELGWRIATEPEVANYVAGWPINATQRIRQVNGAFS
jgi:hypothetical protein